MSLFVTTKDLYTRYNDPLISLSLIFHKASIAVPLNFLIIGSVMSNHMKTISKGKPVCAKFVVPHQDFPVSTEEDHGSRYLGLLINLNMVGP